MAILQSIVLVEILDVECPGKILSEEVRGAGLQGAPVAHHRLDAGGHACTGKFLGLRLNAFDDRDGGVTDGKIRVDIQHAVGFFHRLFFAGVGGMALLPVELGGAQEKFGA